MSSSTDKPGDVQKEGLGGKWRWAWLPLPVLLAGIIALWLADLRNAYEAPHLLIALNFVFSTLVSLFVAYLIARTFLVRGQSGLLLLGCGVVIYSLAGSVAAIVGHDNGNVIITIHNVCIWLSAGCQLAGAALCLRPRRPLYAAGVWLALTWFVAAGAVGLVAVGASAGWFPIFFVQGQGGTPIRQTILGFAVVLFAMTALVMGSVRRRSSSPFAYWYALGLGLTAVGLIGVLLQSTRGGVLGWTGRGAQYLGGVYLLVAAIASVRDASAWGIPLDEALRLVRAEADTQTRAARDAAAHSRVQFEAIFNSISEAAVFCNLDRRIALTNPAFAAMFGYSPEEVCGKSAALVYVEPADFEALGRRCFHTGPVAEECAFELRYRRKDGTIFWAESTGTRIRDGGGNIIGYLGVHRDITQRKHGEQERELTIEFLRMIAEARSTRELVRSALDFLQRISGCEAVGVRLREGEDYPYYEYKGFSAEFVRREDSLCCRNASGSLVLDSQCVPFLECMCGNIISGRFDASRPFFTAGGSFWTNSTTQLLASTTDAQRLTHTRNYCNVAGYESMSLVPLRAGDQRLGVVHFADHACGRFTAGGIALWERLANALAVAIAKARAEEELQAARVIAEQARAAAESANAAKDHFLAVLSHELRTPLNPALMAATILEKAPELPDGLREDVGLIRRNIELEARLIDDLLDLTRIARGKLVLQRRSIDAADVLRCAIDICQADATDKGVGLSVECRAESHRLDADPARLQQVYWNLLKNAIKFTPAGGTVTVRCRNADGAGGSGRRLVVEVVDTGVGIGAEVLPRIFNAFEQGGAERTRLFGGLGLGLAICKGLVELHGGTICAASDGEGKGAVFTVDLPLALSVGPAAEAPSVDAGTAAPGRRLRVLLVEDHDATVRVMKRLLRSFGHEVITAGSVAGALEAAKDQPFDLLLSDLGLPDGSGHDLLAQLLRIRPVKAIALSGYGMDHDLQKSRDVGFIEHLTKPIVPEQLEAAIGRVMGNGVG